MDPQLTAFAIELFLSLSFSALILVILQPLLTEMLTELCHRDTRAKFWMAFTRLMVFIAPLIVVAFLTDAPDSKYMPLVDVVRGIILHALGGQSAGLVIIGYVIFHFSVRNLEMQNALDKIKAKREGGESCAS